MSKEYKIELPSGNFIAYGTDDEEVQPSYIRFLGPFEEAEEELLYWDRQEWLEDPANVVGAIMGAMYNLSYSNDDEENEEHEGLTMDDLHEGAEVYWNDPYADIGSGYYVVTELCPDNNVVKITPHDGSGGVTEVFLGELS